VIVAMMQVGVVSVTVRQRSVAMPMGVWLAFGIVGFMDVLVVDVVHVRVFVLQSHVGVFVSVSLGMV
jgi:hypothetical protein